MEENLKTFRTKHILNYGEIAEMQKDPKYRNKMIKADFRKLLNRIIEENITSDTEDVDVAYRIQFKVVDGMNILGKLTSIPVMDVVLKTPRIEEPEFIYNPPRKYTLRERLKILITGGI